ncbi:DUF2155 domain-containing protein [Acetobacteraceae bacterium H6797]|nr:DUF2155 domain-containing protein [Acetobacteraceae bacterium H6797]
MKRALLALAVMAGFAAPAMAQVQSPNWVPKQTAELQALDKITARITVIKAQVGQTVTFGTLAITVRSCMSRPQDEVADAAAWIEIGDLRSTASNSVPDRGTGGEVASGNRGVQVFHGWMFAEAPAVHMLEHPVYDLRILSCK